MALPAEDPIPGRMNPSRSARRLGGLGDFCSRDQRRAREALPPSLARPAKLVGGTIQLQGSRMAERFAVTSEELKEKLKGIPGEWMELSPSQKQSSTAAACA